MTRTYSEEDCIEAVERVADDLGKTPTKKEFQQHDIPPSAMTVVRVVGSWSEAKDRASVENTGRKEYTKQDCVEAIEQVAEELGKSPTYAEYQDHDILPTAKVIVDRFGSWNEAKEAASCEVYSRNHYDVGEVPDRAPFTQSEWEEMTTERRSVWRKKMYVEEEKLDRGCRRCGYDEFATPLSFHHVDPSEKTSGVSELVHQGRSYEEIDTEIEKCEVLCANCHMVEEHGR